MAESGNDYTAVELKDFLRLVRCSVQGNKAELIARLKGVNAGIWTELSERTNYVFEEASDGENESVLAMTNRGAVETAFSNLSHEIDFLRRELALV